MKQLMMPLLLVANLAVSSTVLALAMTGRIAAPVVAAAAPGEMAGAADEPKQVFYHAFKPELTVNFPGDGRPRYMQVALTAVTFEEAALPELERHSPAIHNALLLKFSGVSADPLTTREGKQLLLTQALETVRGIMLERYGKEVVEEIYFTRFVLQ